jgi:hypothetical protein
MKVMHKMNIRRILDKQDGDSMVVVASDKYGFIWAGRAKFVFNNFDLQFFNIKPAKTYRDSTNALVLVIS